MKKVLNVFILIVMLVICPNEVFAHPGRTDGSGCHKCNTNCSKWGLTTGEYHCHSGNTYTNSSGSVYDSDGNLIKDGTSSSSSGSSNSNSNGSSSGSSSSNSSTTVVEDKKSSDTGIDKIIINDRTITNITDTMDYPVNSKRVNISLDLSDSNATYKVTGNVDNLSAEEVNVIKIVVTAENGTTKTYTLNVTRLIKESEVRISYLKVNDESVYFSNDENDKVDLSNSENSIEIDYKLTDTTADLIITKDGEVVSNGDEVEVGVNEYVFTIIDIDGNEYSYNLIVDRATKTEDFVSGLMSLAVTGGVGYGVYYFIKKKKKKTV